MLDAEDAASDLRAAVWSAQHDSTCEDAPPHPWTDHLPWDSAEDEQDAIRQADAIIAALRPVPSPEPLDGASSAASPYLRDALEHWLANSSSIEAADDLRTAAAEWLRDIDEEPTDG